MTSPAAPVVPRLVLRAIVEVAVVGFTLVLGLAFAASGADTTGPDFSIDLLAGGLSCMALPLRHRHPVALALALVPINVFSETARWPTWSRCSRWPRSGP